MPYRYPRPHTKSRARWNASRTIGRAWRRRRKRRAPKGRQRYNRQSNKLVTRTGNRSRGKLTLKKRVAQLEVSAKKHVDTISLTDEEITWNGTTQVGGAPLSAYKNSYTNLLHIQGPLNNGELGNPALEENEQRQSDSVFATSVVIRGQVYGVRPKDLMPATFAALTPAGQVKMKSMCNSAITITILRDKRPSQQDATGTASVNLLPQASVGETAIESIYGHTVTGGSLLQFFGTQNALKSYKSTRFTVMHQEVIKTSYLNPMRTFEIKIKINKKLKFVPARPPPATTNPNSTPYNYNLAVFFTVVSPPEDLSWANYLSAPKLDTKTSRLYFKDV